MTIYQPTISGSTEIEGNVNVNGSVTATNFTGSLFGTASYATTAATASYFLTSSITSASYAATASSANDFVVRQSITASSALITGTLIAQTLVVQTVTSSVVYSSGSNMFGNLSSDVQQMTGSLRVSGSGNHFIIGGSIGIGTSTFDVTNPEALLLSGSGINVISCKSNINNYTQLNIINKNVGAAASSDIVTTNDTGNETGNFVDLGINGSGFSGLIGGPNDAYLYTTGSNLLIGNQTRGNASLKLFSGNDATVFPIIVTGSNAIITGSLLGTASYAVTASYALSSAGGSGGSGLLIDVRYLTTGSSSYTPSAGTKEILLEMVGGGGGGGGVSTAQYACGAGGGAGAYIKTWVRNISDATTYAISIGTSGSGGAGAGGLGALLGGSGGNTTFTTAAGSSPANRTFTAGGGAGGEGSIAGKASRQPGRGGIPTNGDIAASGGPGQYPLSRAGTEGNNTGGGGSSPFGGGGVGISSTGSANVIGSSSIGYGGGGGGAYAGTTPGARGGNGSFGLIVVYEYT